VSTEANDRLVAVEELETLPTLDGTSSPAHESRSCVRVHRLALGLGLTDIVS
jgi:hypothetical protein